MAYIFDIGLQKYYPLAPHHTFGRLSATVNTHIDKPYISKLHTAIEWNGKKWQIKNLGLNGTFLNSVALRQGENRELVVGDIIHFAELTDSGFHVSDLAAPANMLWSVDSDENFAAHQLIYLDRYNLLPHTEIPEVAVYFDEQDQRWYLEFVHYKDQHNEQQRQPIHAGDIICISQKNWQFISAEILGPTEVRVYPAQTLTDIEFIFNLSLDEETTQLELHHHQQTINLAVRSHHYLLLQLARHRAADAARGVGIKSQGWIYTEQLATELGLDTTHMNIHIFRLRKQLADSLPNAQGQQYLLERRGGKIRFGCTKFKIYKGETLTTESPLSNIDYVINY